MPIIVLTVFLWRNLRHENSKDLHSAIRDSAMRETNFDFIANLRKKALFSFRALTKRTKWSFSPKFFFSISQVLERIYSFIQYKH